MSSPDLQFGANMSTEHRVGAPIETGSGLGNQVLTRAGVPPSLFDSLTIFWRPLGVRRDDSFGTNAGKILPTMIA
jgi:hypothetical protein